MANINKIYNIQEYQQIITAATPSNGASIIYPKIDGNWYYMNSDGVEKIQSLSYNIGNGLTTSIASGAYNYNLSVNIDNYGLTFTNGVLSIGYITASSLSQLGNATASYILSVNSSGLPLWVPYTTQGINGALNYVSKFSGTSSLTNSNIYDSGTYISMFTTSNSAPSPKLFINGSLDTSTLYLNSGANTNLTSDTTIITINSQGLRVTDSTRNYLWTTRNDSTGNTFNILDSLVKITSLGSTNFTASLVISNGYIGIGTATPSNIFHINATQSAFRLQDGSQGYGKYLISDSNGVASWATVSGIGLSVLGSTLSVLLQTNSGLTVSNLGLGVQLINNSGLTLSSLGLAVNPLIAGFGLSYSSGQLSVTSAALTLNFTGGLVSVGGTVSINTGTGLTISANKLILDPTIIGSGLTYSGGSISTVNFLTVNGSLNYIPLFNGTSSLTSSNIYQISNNIIIGTTSNIGAKLYIAGTFSFVNDGIISGANIGRGNSSTNLLFGDNALAALTSGNYNIAIGDNSLIASSGTTKDNIAIGVSSSANITGATATIGIGNYVMSNNTSNSNAVAIGYNAASRAGANSVSIGAYSGTNVIGGDNSISIGFGSGNSDIGSSNIFLGYLSGKSFTGSYSVFIGGYNNNLSTSNNIFISDGQGNLRLYVPSTGNLLVGTMSDDGAKLQIAGSASIYGSLKIKDGTQAKGKILISDDNGITSWFMPSGIGMTISGYTFSVILQNNSGLTVSSNGLGITIQINSGLTISSNGLTINSSIAGYGLTFSSGSMSFTTNINAVQGYIPYFNTTTSLTSSVIYQTSSNILVATTSNDGARFVVAGSASIYGSLKIADGTQALNRLLISDANGLASWTTASTILGPNFFLQGGNSFGATATLGTNDNRNMQVIAGGNNIILFATSSMTLNVPIQYSNSLSSSASLNNNGVIVTNTTNGANGIGINAASGGNPNLNFYVNTTPKAGIGYTNIANPANTKGLALLNLAYSTSDFQLFLDDSGSLQWRDPNSSSALRWIIDRFGGITHSPAALSGAAATSIYSITQSWNTTGTPTAIKLNITDTNSATASLFLDLQKNSNSVFNVDKNGNTNIFGNLIIGTANSFKLLTVNGTTLEIATTTQSYGQSLNPQSPNEGFTNYTNVEPVGIYQLALGLGAMGGNSYSSFGTYAYYNTAATVSAYYSYNTAIGYNALGSTLSTINYHKNSIALGHSALINTTQSINSIAIGNRALYGATVSIIDSISIGFLSTSGNSAIAIGNYTVAGVNSVVIGVSNYNIGNNSVTIGYHNNPNAYSKGVGTVLIGAYAGSNINNTSQSTPANNVAIGYYSLGNYATNKSGNFTNNIAIGPFVGINLNGTGITENVLIGNSVGYNSPTMSNSVVLGSSAMYWAFGSNNVTIGYQAANGGTNSISSSNNNVKIGYQSGANNWNDIYNTFLGSNTGIPYNISANATYSLGRNNVFIGAFAGATDFNSYKLRISSGTSSTAENNLIYGDFINKYVIINATGSNPVSNGSNLQVNGSMSIVSSAPNAFQLKDTTYAIGKVLTSDANGYGTWQSLTASGVVYKYSATQSFSASIPYIINHNLNTQFYIIQLFDYPTGDEIMGSYTNRGLTQATITLSSNVSNVGVIIMG